MPLPHYRSGKYLIYHACERFRILPPGIKEIWEENNVESQANILAYDLIRTEEEVPKERLF